MEKKKIAIIVTVGSSELARAQALKFAQEKFPNEIVEVIDESQVPKNPYKDLTSLTYRFCDSPKEKRHTATLMKKGGKKQKNRYSHQRR